MSDFDGLTADWPPLTREQKDQLAILLRPGIQASGNGNKPKPPIDGRPHPRPLPSKPIPPPPKPKGAQI